MKLLYCYVSLLILGTSGAHAQNGDAEEQNRCEVADPTGTPLNVRKEKNGSEIVGTLENGRGVTVLGRELDQGGRHWSHIKTEGDKEDKGVEGWVYREYIACWCSAKDITTRVLTSPWPNDLHKNWSGKNYIGKGWQLNVKETINGIQHVIFIMGDLYSPRGGLVDENVFGLRSEWNCE